MKRIKWIHDKSECYRGNKTQFAFRLNNSKFIFEFDSVLTYSGFRYKATELARYYGATQIEVLPVFNGTAKEFEVEPFRVLVKTYRNDNDDYVARFFKRIDKDEEKEWSYRYYEPSEIFDN
jgi:hypothetical protein